MVIHPIKVLIVDDHIIVRKGIRALLGEYLEVDVIGDIASGVEAVEMANLLHPEVILVSLPIPVSEGVEIVKEILGSQPDARILVLACFSTDIDIIPTIKMGAMGFVSKDSQPEDLISAIRQAYRGEPTFDPVIAWKMIRNTTEEKTAPTTTRILSDREFDVLRLLAMGRSNQEIAEELSLTEVTVRTHISRILSKLGLTNRVQAALFALRNGLITLEESI